MRLIALIIVVLGLGGYLFVQKETLLSHWLSKKLSCTLSIKEVKLGLNSLTLKGVQIKNPPNCRLPYALTNGSIVVTANLWDFLKGTIPISQIHLESGILGIELYNSSGSENNWNTLLKEFTLKRDGKGFTIDRLVVTNLQFKGLRSKKEFPISPLYYLELDHLGTLRPLCMGQVGQSLFEGILFNLKTKPHLAHLLEDAPTLESPHPKKPDATVVAREGLEMFRHRSLLL